MDSDLYNEISTEFEDVDTLQYGAEDVQNKPAVNIINTLNSIERRPPKRICPPDDFDALDWHMRVNCADIEKENNLRREMLSDDLVGRLAERIAWARKKRCLAGLQAEEGSKRNTAMEVEKDEVLQFPPRDGSPWIGFTAPSTLQRFYIALRSAEPLDGNRDSHKQRSDSLNFGFTEAVLNSGGDFEMSDCLIPEIEEMEAEPSFIRDELWVEKYAPHSYADLISDESVNRVLLNWMKLWDECVFQRSVPDVVFRGLANQQQLMLNNEKPKRPLHKVVLVAGPAGAGKTTLATLVALHAGYRVISQNASDERNVADFEKCFEDALRTTRTLDARSQPNCLILDEIDGAPTHSIHYLCKAITATGRRSVRRPVICVCNNLYTPSLRELRSIALVLNLSRTNEKRLVKRLEEISKMEQLEVEAGALPEIIDSCSRDLRSAINALQFIAAQNHGLISRKAIQKFCERERQFGDKSLFDSWASVFDISRHLDANSRIRDRSSRMKRIAFLSEKFGSEIDHFYMGLFSNYLASKNAAQLINASMAVKQFCYYDRLVTSMNSLQDYNLLKYLSVVCVGIHLILCCRGRVHLSFPSEHQNAVQCRQQSVEIVESVRAGATQRNLSLPTIALEILPYLVTIVQPDLKPMNAQLYSVRELGLLRWVVSVMRSYSLTYTSISQDGSVNYVFKPAIDQLVIFANDEACCSSRSANTLSNAARQLIAHEIELEKLRNVDVLASRTPKTLQQKVSDVRDKCGKLSGEIAFYYNQGSSNAIRRTIKMKNFFSS